MIEYWELEVTIKDLQVTTLVDILKKAGAQVRQEGDSLFLIHPFVGAELAHKLAFERAARLVLALNFLIRRLHGRNSKIHLNDVVGFSADGTKQFLATARDGVAFNARLTAEVRSADGELVMPPELPTEEWARLLLGDASISLVSELLSRQPLGWNDLYRSLEIIADDVGGLHKITSLGWATKESLRRFKRTANSPSAIGLDARHGVDQGEPPSSPMILSEAVALLETIVYQWMWSKT